MVSLFFKNSNDSDVGSITIDATPSENHSYESTPTQNPIETGANISDHIRKEPEKISIEGMVTNSPVIVLSEGESFTSDKAQLAFDLLEEAYQNRYLVDVVTRFKTYFNMCMTSLVIPRTNRTGDAIVFNASFQKIVKVNSILVPIATVSSATTGAAAGTNKRAPTNVKKGKQSVSDSLLYDTAQMVGILPK